MPVPLFRTTRTMAGASLFTLLDDIATMLDDVAVMTKVATKKTAGVLGDDLALNAQQVTGVDPSREIPVVLAVAKGSLINKAILVPAALAMQLLLTGHMDTVFPADHPFQSLHWREPGVLNAPGAADMKGGIAILLAALKALEASPWAADLGYEVVLNSDEEVSSPGSAPLLMECARRVDAGPRAASRTRCRGWDDGARPRARARPGRPDRTS